MRWVWIDEYEVEQVVKRVPDYNSMIKEIAGIQKGRMKDKKTAERLEKKRAHLLMKKKEKALEIEEKKIEESLSETSEEETDKTDQKKPERKAVKLEEDKREALGLEFTFDAKRKTQFKKIDAENPLMFRQMGEIQKQLKET